MRLFEWLILLPLLPVLIWPLLPVRRPRVVDFLPLTAVAFFFLHYFVEGGRWQMIPAYVFTLVVFLATAVRLWPSLSPPPAVASISGKKIIAVVAGLLLWLAVLALPVLLPVPKLPSLTGPYAVGTRTYHLVDRSRPEIYTAQPDDKREIMVQVWYPAAADAQGEEAPYMDQLDVVGATLAERLGLPSFLLNHINLVHTQAVIDAPLASNGGPFPVLTFSHGLQGIRGQNTSLVRDLASHGFVVATIDHTYGNAITVFPDGRAVLYNPDVLSGEGEPPHTSNTLVGVWADDIGFVLDKLAVWNEEAGNAFNGRLDLSRVGVFGHSTGGGATVQFCGRDPRCQAGVGLDAWVVPVSGVIVADGLDQPFMFLRAAQWEFNDAAANDAIAETLYNSLTRTGYLATVSGAAHFDFSDLPLFSPLAQQLGLSGPMAGDYVVGLVNDFVVRFFAQTLQGADEPLPVVYPEVTVVGNGR